MPLPRRGAQRHVSADRLMDLLHSYWRMEYVTSPKDPAEGERSNPFKDLPSRPDHEVYILHRGEHNYSVLNRYPYNPGHVMVLPYREVRDVSDLRDDERNELFALMVQVKLLLEKVMRPDGFNIGINLGSASGAGIPKHLHLHVVPRWNGDSNFLSVIAGTRTLPEALDKTWAKLREAI